MGVSGFVNHVHLALRSLNCDGRRGVALLLACVFLLLLTLSGESGQALLRYERSALASGQWWRLLSAHVVHEAGDPHLLSSRPVFGPHGGCTARIQQA